MFASDSANVNTSGNITSVKKYSLTAEGVTPSGNYTETVFVNAGAGAISGAAAATGIGAV